MCAVWKNTCLQYEIDAEGQNQSFVDLASGLDYCQREPVTKVARVRLEDGWHDASAAAANGSCLELCFAGTAAIVSLEVATHLRHLVLTVAAASEQIQELELVNLQLMLDGQPGEPFAACALALNLLTDVPEMPGLNSRVRARSVARFGIVGAAVAVVGCPQTQMRDVLKEAVTAAPDMPQSPVGGPWAMDAAINRSSYLFANPTEANVEEMIDTLKSVGFNQVQIHGGGGTYRFGDCEPNRELYPRGIDSIKAVISRLHQEGIYVGMHPYAFFIDKACPWVTPVPDPRLASDSTFTLTEDLTADAATVPVLETTQNMSTITGFFERNSVALRVDSELIIYAGLSQEPPYAFTQCQRGALGTRATAHRAGARVDHLKECFGLFAPDPETSLLQEVAAANAEFFNACGFDSLYLDALDGEDILGGGENSWHYGSMYVWELWRRLERPAAMEYSTFHHHLWCMRSRHGAWDHPTRSHKQFIDQHVASNQANDRIFLPSNLGWWGFKSWNPAQVEPTYPDDIEYLCAKALGTDSGLSLQGYDPGSPGHQRLAAIVRAYEQLRHAGHVPQAVKDQLRQLGAEFALDQTGTDAWTVRPQASARHVVQASDGLSSVWTVDNPYQTQPPTVRLEALMATPEYDSSGSTAVVHFGQAEELSAQDAATGVSARMELVTENGNACGRLTATNSGSERGGTWARFQKIFDPPLDLSQQQGLGIWVRGDGQGEVLNFQLRSPDHITRAVGEHYVTVDFEGWRYFQLIEHDSDRYADYDWPYAGGYSVYREAVDYSAVASISIWCNNLPPNGTISCDLRPVHALPLVAATLSNPHLSTGGQNILLPLALTSGNYVEIDASGDYRHYSGSGELLERGQLAGPVPLLHTGENELSLSGDVGAAIPPRTRVAVFTRGEPLQ